MELLLINHPLDCPVCDKGGECPLQNQAMSNGRGTSRFEDVKRTYPKPINISSQVLLDRERCVLCARCTRFSDQIAGDPFIALRRARRAAAGRHLRGPAVRVLLLRQHRADLPGRRADRCGLPVPVAARSTWCRPRASASTARRGCSIRTDHRRGVVLRRMAGERPGGQRGVELRQGPLGLPVRHRRPTGSSSRWSATSDGELRVASLARGARGRGRAGSRAAKGAGVLVGGRVVRRGRLRLRQVRPRSCSRTNDVDFRARPHSAEEADFLGLARRRPPAPTAAR